MAGNKMSGRKPNLSNTDAAHLERRKRAKQAQENNKDFSAIGATPSYLSTNSKRLYRSIVTQLNKKALLVNLDRTLLTIFCENVELSRAAAEDISKNGITLIDDGHVKKNPAVDIKNNADKQIKSIGSSLGLDPMSRASLLSTKPIDSPKEEMNDFLRLVSNG
jgi:P27 family predicted phage terminase small subunit